MSDCSDSVADFDDPFYNLNISAEDCNCSDYRFMYHELCNCDYPDAEPPPLVDILPLGFIYAFFFIVGILGNSMVIFVVARYKQMKSVTNIFLASLSTSDLYLIIFCIPVQYMKYLTYTWEMGEFLCHSVHYVQLFTMICSVLTLTAISIERYLAIAFPMKAMGWSSIGRAKRIIGIIWFCASILALPSWFTNGIVSYDTKRNKTAIWCVKKFGNLEEGTGSVYEKSYALYQTVVLFAIPVAVMTFCYVQVGRVLYFANKHYSSCPPTNDPVIGRPDTVGRLEQISSNCHQQKQTLLRKSAKMSDQNVKQIIQMLIAVVLLFIICWSPYVIDDLLIAFRVVCAKSQVETLKYMRMAFALMAYSNSCQNPLVYAFMSKHFKNKFRTLCCRCSIGGGSRPSDMNSPRNVHQQHHHHQQQNTKQIPSNDTSVQQQKLSSSRVCHL